MIKFKKRENIRKPKKNEMPFFKSKKKQNKKNVKRILKIKNLGVF